MTIRGSLSSNPFGAVVNNAGIDPMQGFDVEVWATDLATGQVLDIGQFQSCTFTIRNATETYLTLGQRIPTYYDGEIQIAWVLERGKLNVDNLSAWFGTNDLNRNVYIGRGPRFQITIDYNAVGLQGNGVSSATYVAESGPQPSGGYFDPVGAGFRKGTPFLTPTDQNRSKGRIHLVRCKLDSMSEGIMPGRRIIANRWEGVSEGYIIDLTGSYQDSFKSKNTSKSSSPIKQGVDVTNVSSNIT
jgi:hypothetical protein